MAKPPPPTSTSDPALPTTTSSAPKSSSRPAAARLLDPLATSARSLLASARRSPVTTLAAAFFLLALVMYGEDARTIAELSIDDYLYPDADLYNVSGLPPLALPPPTCDLSRGRWVFDNVSVPAYREKDCTFLTKQVTCLANGRPDDMWQYWRWQPNDCSLPTFDARRFMEAMRGKRLMFVGDSLNRNQWESLVCLVQPILSKGRKKIVKRGSFNTFYAKEYRATLEFYWAPFLVESNSDNPNFHSIKERIISPERIESHAKNWKDVDYLIFNTYIWWMNNADIKVRRPNSKYWSENDEVPRIEAYGQVFKTWSDWLNDNIDPARTSVFFMTISSPHLSPQNWRNPDLKTRERLEQTRAHGGHVSETNEGRWIWRSTGRPRARALPGKGAVAPRRGRPRCGPLSLHISSLFIPLPVLGWARLRTSRQANGGAAAPGAPAQRPQARGRPQRGAPRRGLPTAWQPQHGGAVSPWLPSLSVSQPMGAAPVTPRLDPVPPWMDPSIYPPDPGPVPVWPSPPRPGQPTATASWSAVEGNYNQQISFQELNAKDLHGTEWKLRHIY